MTFDSVSPPQPNQDEDARRIGWIPIAGFSIALMMMLVPLPLTGRVGAAVGDLAHAPLFGCFTIAGLALWHRRRPLKTFAHGLATRMAAVGGGVFLLGILIEIAQSSTGRDGSLHDVIANGLGILAALALCFAFVNSRLHPDRHGRSVVAITLAALLGGLATVGPMRILLDVHAVQRSFPQIASFEHDRELTRWYFDDAQGRSTDQNVTHGRRAMRILVERAPHPAATLVETVSDWSAVQTLELDVTLARSYPSPAEVILKVIDRDHADFDTDTARKSFWVEPGELTHLTFQREEMIHGPLTRTLDLARIKFISLLVVAPERATWIDVDHIHVTR